MRPASSRFDPLRKRAACLSVLVVLCTLLPLPASWVEYIYSRGLYPWISSLLVPFADLVSFPLGTVLVVALVAGSFAWLIRVVLRQRRERRPFFVWVFGVSRSLLFWMLAAYATFLALWGANYRRMPIEEQLEFASEEVEAEELLALGRGLAAIIRRDMPSHDERDEQRALASIRRAMEEMLQEWYGKKSPTLPRQVKRLPPGFLLSFGTSGWMVPLFLEPHTDGALPPDWYLGTAAHELAHAAGFSGEADADVVGVLAGLRADDAFARYAVALHALGRSASWLRGKARREILASLPERARKDLSRRQRIFSRYSNERLRTLQSAVYDAYLQSQGVEAGVADYSRSVELLILARRAGLLLLPQPPIESL